MKLATMIGLIGIFFANSPLTVSCDDSNELTLENNSIVSTTTVDNSTSSNYNNLQMQLAPRSGSSDINVQKQLAPRSNRPRLLAGSMQINVGNLRNDRMINLDVEASYTIPEVKDKI
eukprot:scaffold3829_cov45-Cyclotella_meneghiniana.AAC.5